MPSNQAKHIMHTALARARYGLVAVLLLAQLWVVSIAQAQQAVPELTGHVIDQTSTLSAAETQALGAKLSAYEQAKGSQIVVLLVKTTQPEDIAAYAYRVASTWKIGRQGVGDGVLVVVAKDDRRMRIEVAKDVEGAIPDLMAARIIDTGMKPRFQAGDFAGGLSNAVDMITARLDGEELPAVSRKQQKKGVDITLLIFAVVFASLFWGSILKAAMGRGLGSAASGIATGILVFFISGVLLTAIVAGIVGFFTALFTNASTMLRRSGGPIILGGGGWGNDSDDFGGGFGGGGFGGGGGWGSGGGGSFGGGGASGGW